ncbi:hypothetical protein ACGFWI_01345 [Streptomyces sp. NPDC048434]|uniref:hypothetical protein n=1 Tax=Streptomyces sp. NPDC048434 TaxID=3365549 RepID=UPI00371E4F1C
MPTAGDQLPPDMQAMARRVATLEREVRELRAARRLEQATIGAGGVRIVNGGRHAMDTSSGVRMVDIGAIADERFDHPDGTPQQAMWLRREDGTLLFSCFAGTGGGTQAWSWRDRSENQVVADDTTSGSGLARPYLPVQLTPAFDGGWDYWPRTSATSMAELWYGIVYKQQPRIVVAVEAAMDTSGATGFIEVRINGVAQGSPTSIGFTALPYTLGPFDLGKFAHMQQITVSLMGRRNTGTGAIRASVTSAYTIQS